MPNTPDYYLLMLQDFRNATGDFFTPFFEEISALAISPVVLVMFALFYWMIDKQNGIWFFLSYSAVQFVNAFIKLTFCVYRPWIHCQSLTPAGDAITTAQGYSFPSGHSSSAAAIYGMPMFGLWNRHRWASVLLGMMILLTMFSRNYLGVHTLQDVIVGAGLSLVIVVLVRMLLSWVDKGTRRDLILVIGSFFLTIAAAVYFTVKPYPMDYVDNVLLVDPVVMKETAFIGLGFFSGFAAGWFIERRFIGFDNSGVLWKKSLVGILGVVVFGLVYLFLHKVALRSLPVSWRFFIEMFSVMLYIVGLWPIAVKKFVNVKDSKDEQ